MTSSNFEIRTATPADLDTIVGFSHKLFQEDAGQRDQFTNINWAPEFGHDYFRPMISNDTFLCLLAFIEKKAVGFLIGYLKKPSDVRPINAAELHSMFVDKEVRSQKIGEALAQHFLQWAEENGSIRASVSAYAANVRAIKFYESLGFAKKNVSLEIGLNG